MSWTSVLAIWPSLVGPLCAAFPHLDELAMRRFRGDRRKLEIYFAETHDLTLSEASETIDDWVNFVAVRYRAQVAA